MAPSSSPLAPGGTVPYDQCTLETCPLADAQLVYAPNLAGNVLFLSIFSACLVVNLGLGIWYRTWGYLVAMSVGCTLEILGYVGRIQMHYNPFPQDPFLLYLICVTIASVFFTAAIYLCLARIVVAYGEKLSFLRPRTYTFLFVFCDFVSLLLQAGGGTIVSIADSLDFSNIGVHISEAGLAFQVLSLLVFMTLCGLFAWACHKRSYELEPRFSRIRAAKRFKFFLWTLSFATIFMLIRCSFRVAELSSGFNGAIWDNELDYMVLEGAMASMCAILLTVGHPGHSFSGQYHAADFKLFLKKSRAPKNEGDTSGEGRP